MLGQGSVLIFKSVTSQQLSLWLVQAASTHPLLEGDRRRDGAVLLALEPTERTNLQFNSSMGSYLRDGLHLFLLCVGSSSVQHFEEVGCLGPHTCVDVGLGDKKMQNQIREHRGTISCVLASETRPWLSLTQAPYCQTWQPTTLAVVCLPDTCDTAQEPQASSEMLVI